jgi:hypothetical protein
MQILTGKRLSKIIRCPPGKPAIYWEIPPISEGSENFPEGSENLTNSSETGICENRSVANPGHEQHKKYDHKQH